MSTRALLAINIIVTAAIAATLVTIAWMVVR